MSTIGVQIEFVCVFFLQFQINFLASQKSITNCAKLQTVFVCVIAQRELEKFMREITMH